MWIVRAQLFQASNEREWVAASLVTSDAFPGAGGGCQHGRDLTIEQVPLNQHYSPYRFCGPVAPSSCGF